MHIELSPFFQWDQKSLSVSNFVMSAASTSKDKSIRMPVIKRDQMNNGVRYCVIAGGFMLMIAAR